MFLNRSTDVGNMLQSERLLSIEGIIHGFGMRKIALGDYLDAMEFNDRFIVKTNQMHGDTVHYLMYPKKGPILEGDAFISDRPGMVCFVRTADCVPILITDKNSGAVAAVHAGWKGISSDVIGSTFRAMNEAFGIQPADCVAAIGPCICGSCFEVGDDVMNAFKALGMGDGWRVDDAHVDLKTANKLLLIRAGVLESNIDISDACTSCDTRFASWRRDRDEDERQFSFISIMG